jgi:uncharacterized membrane protein YdjX (TVP38/TMEM64 family)
VGSPHPTVGADLRPAPRRHRRLARYVPAIRVLALLAMLGVGWWVGSRYDFARLLDEQHVDDMVAAAGAWGVFLYLGLFALGELVHVPGLVFVGAAVVAYGRLPGLGLAFVGAFLSATVGFFFARAVAGRPLTHARRRLFRWVLHRLEQHPVRVIALLRVIFFMAPVLNYALGMTSVRYRSYALGTALGLVPAVVASVFFMDWLLGIYL